MHLRLPLPCVCHLLHSPPCSLKEESENCLLLPSLKPCLLAFPASLLPFGIAGDLQSAEPALYHPAAFLALWLGESSKKRQMSSTGERIRHVPDVEGPQSGALWGQIEPMRICCTNRYYLSQFSFTFAYGVHLASNLKYLFLLLLKLTTFLRLIT